jgi:hypothetical protein
MLSFLRRGMMDREETNFFYQGRLKLSFELV